MPSRFTSAPAGSGRSGVVAELFARLALIGLGALFLAAILFSTVPRPRLSAWRGEARKTIATVGFNDQITLGGLGETIENPQEVMQLKLVDPATHQVYPMRDDVYLRGSVVTWYSQNHWRRTPPPTNSNGRQPQPRNSRPNRIGADKRTRPDSASALRSCSRLPWNPTWIADDLFYIWPLVEPVGRQRDLRSDKLYGPSAAD